MRVDSLGSAIVAPLAAALLTACNASTGTLTLQLATAPGSTLLSTIERVRLTLTNRAAVTIVVTGFAAGAGTVAATDPDIYLFSQGLIDSSLSEADGVETLTQRPFAAGTYIIEVHDYDLAATSLQPRCMSVAVTGTPL